MSKVMETTALGALLGRIAGEYAAKRTVFDIPEEAFRPLFELEARSPGLEVMGGRASLPVGPAAGPHSQIAPCLVAAYLSGARVFELKTVQENDALDIEKPCILALDEGHNAEWSTELSLDGAREEYLRGWIAINLLASIWSSRPRDFFFNMSVGYTLDGIKGAKMDAFIEGMRSPASGPFWKGAMRDLDAFAGSTAFSSAFGREAVGKARSLLGAFPSSPLHSVTLSTMHGCPPAEIERIGRYLIEEKGFDAYVKLNPTLLGYDEARSILDRTGWKSIALKRETFERDLQFRDAVKLVESLGSAAKARGLRFGVKLSNTLANANDGSFLPGTERYMSGRALFPITIRLAQRLSEALPGFPRRFSYCGGASALNARELVEAGLGPVTVATDILKPGGYLRLAGMARETVAGLSGGPTAEGVPDPAALARLAESALTRPQYRKDWKSGNASIGRHLPTFDCFAAPCMEACPVGQKVPEYLRLGAGGRAPEALATILADNPLPLVTGTLCDHACQYACSRNDYEGPVEIRAAKLACAKAASVPAPRPATVKDAPRVAVIGAGPGGLSAAHHLALAGIPVVVFDSAAAPGGTPANVIPRFRIAREDLVSDIDRVRSLGAEFRLDTAVESLEPLRKEGFAAFVVACGALSPRELRLEGSGLRVVDALAFLEATAAGPGEFAGARNIVVAGGGNTAMDATRQAARLPGARSVKISYRRTRDEMPADREELENAIREAQDLSPGPALLELTAPERVAPGRVTLRRMSLGEPDASGRPRPVPSGETLDLDCDLLVAAVGEVPDAALLLAFGIPSGEGHEPDPATQEAAPWVYLVGDAYRGPSSIVASEADGRRAAYAIMAKAGVPRPEPGYAAPAPLRARMATRGDMLSPLPASDAGFLSREADRCLACDSACLRCVEVCPNRANTAIAVGPPLAQAFQILHVDALCNECGNCGVFCPYEGEPFHAKPALFGSAAALRASPNAGFAIGDGSELTYRSRREGRVTSLPFGLWYGAAPSPDADEAAMLALARAVRRDHPYLLGGKA